MRSKTWKQEYNDLLAKSKAKQNSIEDTDAIEPLVESLELMILSVIKNFQKGVASIHKLFDSGKKELFKPAEREVNSSISERSSRFGAWKERTDKDQRKIKKERKNIYRISKLNE